jgi:hypothetical protein
MSGVNTSFIDAALARAAEAVARGPHSTPPDGVPRSWRVAIGDPQADFERFLALLHHHGLLSREGQLRPDVQLVPVGDFFDWGKPEERERSATSSLHMVAWLASHPADQAVLMLGNHDLGRVGELADFTDATFATAQAESDQVYVKGHTDEAREREFLARWPQVPTAELVARDFSAFRAVQRDWVAHLLRVRRFRTAYAIEKDLLVLHAGVTQEDLREVGLPEARWTDAFAVADALNGAVDATVDAWTGGPLVVPGLHQPGNAALGEGVGIFYHRPTLLPEELERTRPTPRRRFDPRRLPLGLTQVVGHTRDKRSRELLGLSGDAATDGVIRHLTTDGERCTYAYGAPPRHEGQAVLVFTDGGMREAPLERYELFDLDARAVVRVG